MPSSLAPWWCVALVSTILSASPLVGAAEPARLRTPREASDRDVLPPLPATEASAPEHFRVGPIFGVGFPRPFAIEGFTKVERIVGIGFEYGFLPRTTFGSANAGFDSVALDLRLFPFRGSFFLGARAGRQWLHANATITAARIGTITESMDASTWFFNPRAGFLHTFAGGITIGIDAGVQFPIGPSYSRSGPATNAGLTSGLEIETTLALIAKAFGNSTTPTVDLLRLGFLF